MPALQCAVVGCNPEENEVAKELVRRELLEDTVAVEGLPLTNLTVAYYYVEYGTVLAFLSRANQNYCLEALSILSDVRAKFSDDPILMEIVTDSEGICNRLLGSTDELIPSPTPEQLQTTPFTQEG
jgi:hypothetical protein